MTDLFFLLLYFGGMNVAYVRNRNADLGRIKATLESLVWPWNVGRNFARSFYTTDHE